MGVWYATREQVKDSLEIAATASANQLIDSKLETASRTIESFLHRRFYPERRTVQMDWPNYQYAYTWQLWLGDNELITLEELTSGGNNITADSILRRGDDRAEPPYTYIEINLNSNTGAFGGGTTFQRSLGVTGVFGYNDTSTALPAGTLGATVNAAASTLVINPSNGYYPVGVGALLLIGTERIILTNRRMSDTGQNLASTLDALQSDSVVTVSDGTTFALGETILLGAERMRIDDIAGNNLIVTRAWDGSNLTTHIIGEDLYALRSFTARRGTLGSTAAGHNSGDAVYMHEFPGPVNELCVAETVVLLEQSSAGYARVVGSGPSQRESSGAGLTDIRERAWIAYGRKSRKAAI
jgi:hypothetical protein